MQKPAACRRHRPRPPLITEAHVQQTVTEFLQLNGWRAIRTDPVSDRLRGKGFGEVGMPDYLYVRYHKLQRPSDAESDALNSLASVLWIEFKRPGEAPTPKQAAWHDAERLRGALVMAVDDIDGFIEWYNDYSDFVRRV